MEISKTNQDGCFTLAPSGDVDLSVARALQMEIRAAMDTKPIRMIVDLASVPYMDSSGVATLVEAMQIARKQDTRLVLCCMQDKVRSIFEIARLDRVFTIVASTEDAEGA
jgi:anti-sigma B factor antagonist